MSSVGDREAWALHLWDEGVVRPEWLAQQAVDTLAPLIEAQVREQIAQEIEAARAGKGSVHYRYGYETAVEDAAAIARRPQAVEDVVADLRSAVQDARKGPQEGLKP